MREKLIELLGKVICTGNGESLGSCPDRKYGLCGEVANLSYCVIQNIANHLIANGVTVQEWISVKDRLPENICPVLVVLEGISTAFNGWYHDGKWWTVGAGTRPFTQKVTHWMPLPQPPKEG